MIAMQVMKTPRTVDIDITSRCNLRCRYCYHFSGPGDVVSELPKEEWLHFFKELKSCAVMDVMLTGGEPFIREDILELLDGIVANRMRFSILSNGTLVTDEIAKHLAATGRCNEVQISLDGASPKVHESCRGKGSFQGAINGIRILQKNGVPVSVRVTIHRNNVSSLEDIASFLFNELDLPTFSTNAASYMGLCRSRMNDVGLTIEDRVLAMDSLAALNRKYDNRITANAGPLAEAQLWTEAESARLKGEIYHGGGYLTGCGCVMNTIAVRADGVIVPCTMLSQIELGRVNKDDLTKIWQMHPEIEIMRTRNKTSLAEFKYCQGCDFIKYCTGNCPGLAFTITGEVNHPSPDACYREFLRDGGRLPEEIATNYDG